MKGIIIVALSPFIALFAVAACQTIEFHMLNETPVPVLAWVLVLITLIWIAFAASLPKQDYKKADRLIRKLTDENPKSERQD